MSNVMARLDAVHECAPPSGVVAHREFPPDTVWACGECTTTWVSKGLTGGGRQPEGGYRAPGMTWQRERSWRRRRRERQAVARRARTRARRAPHECAPPREGVEQGGVWPCSCGMTWVCVGREQRRYKYGYAPRSLLWRKEGIRARRRRELAASCP